MAPLIKKARKLRKNMTEAEQALWNRIRDRQLSGNKFRKQAPIHRFVVDFVCFEKKLILEIDGSQHKGQIEYDKERTAWLMSQGFTVLRFWNNDVLQNMEGVIQRISSCL